MLMTGQAVFLFFFVSRLTINLSMNGGVKLMATCRSAFLLVLLLPILVGCGKKTTDDPALRESEEFMLANGQRRGVVTTSEGWQYEILNPGSDVQFSPSQKMSGKVVRRDREGNPIFDGTGSVFLRSPDSFGNYPVRKALTMVGEGGVVRIFLPTGIKSGLYAQREDDGNESSVLIWDVHAGKMFTEEEKRAVGGAMLHPSAGVLIFDQCGSGKPDMLLPEGCETDLAAYGERFFDPACRPLENKNMVAIALVGSQMRNPDWSIPPLGRWEWVGPCAGILVSSDIPEGRSPNISEYIYGTNTGGQDWKNSYEAISFLDSDRDGWLTGEEMDKVAVWTDRNINGAVDPGEVLPAKESLQKINVRPTAFSRLDWHINGNGVVLKDGKSASSWCWATRGAK
jgi:hypothetical protein